MSGTHLSIILFLSPIFVLGQISVTVNGFSNTNPALFSSYPSLDSAINSINRITAMSGPVTLTLASNTSEKAPSAKGYTIGSSTLNPLLNSTNTLTINCNGSGPVTLYAAAGNTTLSGSPYAPDGILKLVGADYVTIDGITFRDTNTVGSASLMEFGVGFFKAAANDGCNQNTIRNCSFYLSRSNNSAFTGTIMPEGSTAILGINALPANVQFHVTPSNGGSLSTNGTNSRNKVYSNTIFGGNNGIVFIGYPAASGTGPSPNPLTFLGDLSNDIGGNVAGAGNLIYNFGGGGTNPSSGIRVNNGWDVNISNNTINNNDGAGINHSGVLRAIYGQSGTSSSLTISGNSITLKSNSGTNNIYAIENIIGSTAAGNKVVISYNSIINCSYNNQSSGNFYGISNSANPDTLEINSNSIRNIGLSSSVISNGQNYFLYNSGQQSKLLKISDNTINDITGIASTNGTHLIYNSGATQNQVISGNVFRNIRRNTSTTGSLYVFNNQSAPSGGTLKFFNNFISQLGAGGNASSFYGFNLLGSANQSLQVFNNSFTDIDLSNVTSSSTSRIINAPTANNQSIYGNLIKRVINGSSSLTMIYVSGASSNCEIYSNIISDVSSAASTTLIDFRGLVVKIYKNKFYNVSNASFSGQLTGFSFSNTSTTTASNLRIYNNLMGHFTAPNNISSTGVVVMSFDRGYAGSSGEISYNTIYLNASSSGATFGTVAIQSFNNGITLNLRNNILINTSTPKGASGYSSVLRASNTSFTSFLSSASNNNFLYGGVPGNNNLIYYDGTNARQSLQQYKLFVSPRESLSLTDTSLGFANFNPSLFFESLNGDDLNYLKPLTCNVSLLDRGLFIAAIPEDYADMERSSLTPDIGAWEVDNNADARVWLGVTNSDWNTSSNWCGGVPDDASNVVIPAGRSFYPVITSSTLPVPECNDISLSGGSVASLTIDQGGELVTYGNWAQSGTLRNGGKISLRGSERKSFPGGDGVIQYMNLLEVNSLDTLTIDRSFIINGQLNPFSGIIKLDNDTITLKSNSDTTAAVGKLGTNAGFVYSGVGRFTVERYIPIGRKWRHLSVPVNDDTLSAKYSWQEGALQAGADPRPGYGTQITGFNYPDWVQRGFDGLSPGGPSMKYYDAATQTYLPLTSTLAPIKNIAGFMVFIRGDRSCLLSNSKQSPTTLRLHGKINTGDQERVIVQVNGFTSIGNPYPSSIDLRNMTKNRVKEFISIWDASLAGIYGVGRFEYLRYDANTGNYLATLGGGYYAVDSIYNNVQSGQAFFVEGFGSGTSGWIDFKEDAKQTGSRNVFRPASQAQPEFMRVTLQAFNSNTSWIADGFRIDFDDNYSNAVDENDLTKFPNPGEGLAIKKGEQVLAIERRKKIHYGEVIQLNIRNMRQASYSIRIVAGNLLARQGMQGWMVDRFTGERTLIDRNGTVEYNFRVGTDAGSRAGDRFYLEFKRTAPGLVDDSVPMAMNINRNYGSHK